MAAISGLITSCTVHPKLSFDSQRYNGSRYKINGIPLVPKRIDTIQHSFRVDSHAKYIRSVGRNHHELTFDNNVSEEPFWSTLIKEFLWGLKSLLAFLAQQPSQLKYIEWPSFPSTLKTATLTLVLVALLIVALSSVDAGLSYLLALLLRRTL